MIFSAQINRSSGGSRMPGACRTALAAGLLLVLALMEIAPAEAQMGGFRKKGMMGGTSEEAPPQRGRMSADGVRQLDYLITESGLAPVFPPGFDCPPIASHFASRTRYDGSLRRKDRNSGLHGGFDITLVTGTPLRAQAAGEVIATGEGGRLEGIYIWLRHAPADTGLPYWIFAKYQHLSELPALQPGGRVQPGQAIALSGATGTTGGPMGPAGYPHLHLSTHFATTGEFTLKGDSGFEAGGQGAVLDDPMIVYLPELTDLSQVRQLPEDRRRLAVGVVAEDGALHPAGSRTVWPVACRRQ